MRTLEACREEVFLRSRRRIRRRNKIRWAIGTGCIPLILAAVLLLVPGSPKSDIQPMAEAVPDGAPPITALGSVTVSVQLPGAEAAIAADPKLAALLEGCFVTEEMTTEPPKERPASAPLTGGEDNGDPGEYSSPAPVRITCQQGDRELCYILLGNQLTCEQIGETVTLSDDQRSWLEECWTVQ